MKTQTLKCQRDLYRLLLKHSSDSSVTITETVNQVLRLLVKITNASLGYIEVRDPNGNLTWSTHQCTDETIEEIRRVISSGIIAEAIRSGKTISTPSAFLDPRYRELESVQLQCIEAVLCSPIKTEQGVQGVLYLQGDDSFESDATQSLMDEDFFSRDLSPLLNQLAKSKRLDRTAKGDRWKSDAFSDLVGESEAFRKTMTEARMIADLDVSVLLTGETGTGKSQLVKAIHRASPRRHGPFVHLNCAVLPEQLVESELFGAMKGAHSSAFTDMAGKISVANHGTLFLDEVGELRLSVQAKFLQFLEEGFYYPLGSKHPVHPDVRIIAASNLNFDKMIQEGRFRADLFFRLNVFSIHMPALSDRKDDIPELVHYFVNKYCKSLNIPCREIQPEAVASLMQCPFPGNIRQLENLCQQAIIRAYKCESTMLKPDHFFQTGLWAALYPGGSSYIAGDVTFHNERDRWEKSFLLERLKINNWNISKTAESIGLSRSHMNKLIKSYCLKR